jgi:hypothetical protein
MKAVLLALMAVAFALVASGASADPIVVTSGNVFVGAPSGLDPPFGFTLTGNGTTINGVDFALGFGGVTPGQTVNLSTSVTPSIDLGPTSSTVNGTTYTAWLGGHLDFSAVPFTAPASKPGSIFSFAAPFTMTGTIGGFTNPSLNGKPLFSVDLRGRGTASTSVRDVGGFFLVQLGTAYDFAPGSPTPEPGTVLMIGTALIVVTSNRIRSLRRGQRPRRCS